MVARRHLPGAAEKLPAHQTSSHICPLESRPYSMLACRNFLPKVARRVKRSYIAKETPATPPMGIINPTTIGHETSIWYKGKVHRDGHRARFIGCVGGSSHVV